MSTHDPFTRGSAVTILPGVPLDGVPAQRTESPTPEALAPAGPAPADVPANPAVPNAPAAPIAPPTALFPAPAAQVPPAAPMPPLVAPVPPAASPVPPAAAPVPLAAAIPPAGPAYVPQSQAFPVAPVFDADIPAAPAAFPIDLPPAQAPAAPLASSAGLPAASPFISAPAPAFPPADAVTPIPAAQTQVPGAPFPPALSQPVSVPQPEVVPDEKQGKSGRRRKEGSSNVSPVKVAAIGAVVIGLAAGWFGHGALSGSDSDTSTPAPVVSHAPVSHVVPLASLAAIGPLHVLPKPWVTAGQQALLSSSVVSSSTPVYFGSGGSHGTYAEMGVSVGTLSKVAAAQGSSYAAGPGGGTVRCGVSPTGGLATSWCTWKDAKSSGMVARFAAPTANDAYRWTQLVRQTLEP